MKLLECYFIPDMLMAFHKLHNELLHLFSMPVCHAKGWRGRLDSIFKKWPHKYFVQEGKEVRGKGVRAVKDRFK